MPIVALRPQAALIAQQCRQRNHLFDREISLMNAKQVNGKTECRITPPAPPPRAVWTSG
jgi:hypothetical protein